MVIGMHTLISKLASENLSSTVGDTLQYDNSWIHSWAEERKETLMPENGPEQCLLSRSQSDDSSSAAENQRPLLCPDDATL